MHEIKKMRWILLCLVVMAAGCAELGLQSPAPVAAAPAPLPANDAVVEIDDMLPPLDAVVVAWHRQCEAPGGSVAVSGSAKQLGELMAWLKRNCTLNENTTSSQLLVLKKLRANYPWPESYVAWLGEWQRELLRLQQWQQRALAAEAEQKSIVKRLKAIEHDLISRP